MPPVNHPGSPRVAVIGATGAVGLTLLELIAERGLDHQELQLVASACSAGRTLRVGANTWPVHALEDFSFDTTDLAFFCAGADISWKWVPVAVGQGATVVDMTGAFSADPGTPLVVPEINGDVLDRRPPGGVLSCPTSVSLPLARVLHGLDEHWGLRQVVVSTYQAASGLGHAGVEELQEGTRLVLQDPHAAPLSERFNPPLTFNVVPQTASLAGSGGLLDEELLAPEVRSLLGLSDLDLNATCVRVPTLNGCAESVWVECRQPVRRDAIIAHLNSLPGITLYEEPGDHAYPTPATCADSDRIHVGRVRVSAFNPRGFWLWIVADNLRAGAALNAVRIAEELRDRGTM
ncbi:aspartate-semialdehyde dehydrogenase [Streptomyces sp. NPDC005438]|uniref:aspartate-semialdehyde dehydrogenase n=1 Tax=Streptomyces sp. NPDC005438 TaxID=3156880 RepID=UPI0033B98474